MSKTGRAAETVCWFYAGGPRTTHRYYLLRDETGETLSALGWMRCRMGFWRAAVRKECQS